MVRLWNRMPRKVVDAPSLEGLKASLDVVLGNLVRWEISLPVAGFVARYSVVSFKPNHSMVLLIYRSYVTYSLIPTPQEHLGQSCLFCSQF